MGDLLRRVAGFDTTELDEAAQADRDLAKASPIPLGRDVEQKMAWHTARRAVIVGPVLIAIFAFVGGWDGAIGAALGVAIVAGNFMLSGLILSRSARVSLSLYHAAALFGFFLRLGLIAVTMLALARAFDIDRTAMGVSVAVSYLVLIAWEAFSVSRGGEKELEWS